MNTIGLDIAVSEIKQACDDAGGEAHRSPFFLVVGAGISTPSVPLAGEIIERCKSQARKLQRDATSEPTQLLDQYSLWFNLAYPQPRERQEYLRNLIETKPISLANLRLAHLLIGRKLTNLIVTSNFDDYVAQALRLFGQTLAVCDHPATIARIDPNRPEVQIVHVHGSYLFYDCANLRGEVRGRARSNRNSSLTVLGFLDSLLWNRSPLVIGYSGWDGDVIMSALRRRLGGGHPLGQNLYWFCYERTAAERLPRWLSENTHVRLVVPAEVPAEQAPPAKVLANEPAPTGTSERTPEVSPKLTAQAVFDKLIEAFDVEEPALFHNPIKHFADMLETVLLRDERVAVDSDPYKLRAVVQLMRDAASPKLAVPVEMLSKLEAVRRAIRRPRYRDAILACAYFVPFRLGELTADQRKEILNAAALAGDAWLSKYQIDLEPAMIKSLAQVLSVDIRLEERLGPLSQGVAVVFPSRPGQMAADSTMGEKPRGAFSFHLEQALLRAIASRKRKSSKPSLQALVIEASTHLLKQSYTQFPVVVGHGLETTIFFDRRPAASGSAKGRLRALLVGINQYKIGSNLAGCVNDVNAFARLLKGHEAEFGRPQVERLTDRDATAVRIMRTLGELTAGSRPEDVLLFHFSGHLTGSLEQTSDSPHARDVLVAHDYDGKGAGQILVSDILGKLAPAKARQKIVILD